MPTIMGSRGDALKAPFGTFATVGLLALLLVPWQPAMPAAGLDPSWKTVIEWGLLTHRQFGTDLLFTFGPLGFLYSTIYHPALFLVTLAFWTCVAVLLGVFIGGLWSRVPWLLSLFLTGAVVLAVGYLQDTWLFVVALAAAWEAIDPWRPRRWLLPALVALTVAAGLIKFTAFIGALALFILADAVRLAVWRKPPYLTLSFFAGSWLLFGAVSAHWNFPAFIAGSFEVAAGYSSAMQLTGPTGEIVMGVIIATIIAAVALLTPTPLKGARGWVTRIGVALSFALISFLLFKAGVVRHDGHITITAAGMLLLATLVAWRAVGQSAGKAVRLLALLVVPLAAYNLALTPSLHWNGPPPLEAAKVLLWDRPKTALRQAVALLHGDALAHFPVAREQALAAIREQHPLPSLSGAVDIYNWDQAAVLAHGLDYSPRPVFQSYSAYTPGLIDRNADFLAGAKAPDFVLFAVQTIDNRLPALEDGQSWPVLWSRYDTISLRSTHTVLQRRTGPDRPIVWGEEAMSAIGWGEPLKLTTDGTGACVWAEVEVQKNLAGRLLSTVFKAPDVEIHLHLADDDTVVRRFIPGMGRTGFLLSPYVEDLMDFLDVCDAGERSPKRNVEGVSFHITDSARRFFDSHVRLKTRSLTIGGQREVPPDASLEQALAWNALGDSLISQGAVECSQPLRWWNDKILAHAPCTVSLGRPTTGRLEIGFGIVPEAWDPNATDGVRFEVRGLTNDGWQTFAARVLRPQESELDRAGGIFVLDMLDGVDEVILVTDPLGNAKWDWSYWSIIR